MKPLLIWSALFVALRLAFVHVYPLGSWSPEEAFRGAVAFDFLQAFQGARLPRLPFWCYQPDSYLGGVYPLVMLEALIFSLAGVSYLSLKLAALCFSLATLMFSYVLLRKMNGLRASHQFALLCCFWPPTLVSLSLIAMGYHTESACFVPLFLLLALKLSQAENTSRLPGLLFGFLSGFAFWFSPLNLLLSLASIFALGVRRKHWLPMFVGGALGLSPLLFHELQSGTPLFPFLGGMVHSPSFANTLTKAALLFARDLPRSLGLGQALGTLYFLILLGGVAAGWGQLQSTLRRFFLSYLLLFTIAYGLSRFDLSTQDSVPYRYLLSFQLLLLLLAAFGFSRLGKLGWVASASLAVLGFSGWFMLARLAPSGRAAEYRGFSYPDLSAHVMRTCLSGQEKLPELASWIESFPSKFRAELSFPFVSVYQFQENGKVLPENPDFAEGFGAQAASTRGLPGPAAAQELELLAKRFSPSLAPRFWKGVARGSRGSLRNASLPADWPAFELGLTTSLQPCRTGKPPSVLTGTWELKGRGAAVVECGVFPERIRDIAETWSQGLSSDEMEQLAWGMGWWLRQRHLSDPLLARDQLLLLPAWAVPGAKKGASAFETLHQLPPY